jgi:hypothetical protein
MKIKIAISLVLIVFVLGCKKQEGIGGDASIHGKVYYKHYNSTFTTLISENYLPDTYVYIIYGNNVNYGQRIKTNYNGEFEFKYLYKGNYKIYTYSLDSVAMVNGLLPITDTSVVVDFTIDKRKDKLDLGTLNVFK